MKKSFILFVAIFSVAAYFILGSLRVSAADWDEIQPAGDSSLNWAATDIDGNGETILAAVQNGRVYLSTNAGDSWTETQPNGNNSYEWKSVAVSSDGETLLASQSNGRLYLSTNAGDSWTETQPNGDNNYIWEDVDVSSDGQVILAGVYSGRLYLSTNGGDSWTETQPNGNNSSLWSTVNVSNDGEFLVAAAINGRIYLSTNGGDSWAETQPAGNNTGTWRSTAISQDGEVILAAIANGRLYLSTNGGDSWAETQPAGDTNNAWVSVSSNEDGETLLALINNGRMYISENGGDSWTETQPAGNTNAGWIGSAINANGEVRVSAAYNGRLYISGEVTSNPVPDAGGAPGRYWVGGDGNWNDSSHWSETSGGAGGASVPTIYTNVYFDENSSSATVTVNSNSQGRNLDFTGFAGTFTGASPLEIHGSLEMSSDMTRNFTGNIRFTATQSAQTIDFADITMNSHSEFDGTGGWNLDSDWNNSDVSITLSRGHLNSNDKNINYGSSGFYSWCCDERTLSLGNSEITGKNWYTDEYNFTLNAGTSTINLSDDDSDSHSFEGGYKTYYNVQIVGNINLRDSNTFNNFTVTGSSNVNYVSIEEDQTITGTLTLQGSNSTDQRMYFSKYDDWGWPTITAENTVLSNLNISDIDAAGDADWSGTSLSDLGGNDDITFTTPTTRYWVGGDGDWTNTANWAASSGGAGGATMPLAQDTVIFDANSFDASSQEARVDQNNLPLGGDITWTGVTNTPSWNFSDHGEIYGSVTLDSTMSVTGSEMILAGRGNHTFTSNEVVPAVRITVDARNGEYSLADNLTMPSNQELGVNSGDFYGNGHNVTVGGFWANNNDYSSGYVSLGSGQWTLTGNSGYVWDIDDIGFSKGENPIIANYGGSSGTRYFYHDVDSEENAPDFVISESDDALSFDGYVNHIDLSDFAGTFTPQYLTYYSDLVVPTDVTLGEGDLLRFAKSSGTQTLTHNNKTLPFHVEKDNNGTLNVTEATLTGSGYFTLYGGTANFVDKTVVFSHFYTDWSNTRALNLGNGTFTLNAGSGEVWFADGSNLTLGIDSDTVQILNEEASSTRSIVHWIDTEEGSPVFNVPSGEDTLNMVGYANTYNLTGFTGSITSSQGITIYGDLTIPSTVTSVGPTSDTLTFAKSSGTQTFTSNNRLISMPVTKSGAGTLSLQDTLTLASNRQLTLIAGTLNSNNQDVSAGSFTTYGSTTRTLTMGSGIWSLTGNNQEIWNVEGSNLTLTLGANPIRASYAGSSGTRTIDHRLALEASAPDFEASGSTDTIQFANESYVGTIDFSPTAGDVGLGGVTIYGDLTVPDWVDVLSSSNTLRFGSATTQSFFNGGHLYDLHITKTGAGALTLNDDLTLDLDRTLTLSQGTLNANNQNVETGSVSVACGSACTLNMGSGVWEIAGNVDNLWSVVPSNVTINPGSSTIRLTGNLNSNRNFVGGGKTYNAFENQTTGSSYLVVTGSNTFSSFFKIFPGRRQAFASGTTTTVGAFTAIGSSDDQIEISTSGEGPHYLVKSGGGVVSGSYLNISDSHATPSEDTWFAGSTSSDDGGNIGWLFGEEGNSHEETPAIFSSISAHTATYSATITWVTDRDSSSQVEFGIVPEYGETTEESDPETLVSSHTVVLEDLEPCRLYYYRVQSTNDHNIPSYSDQQIFATTGCAVSEIDEGSSAEIDNNTGGSITYTNTASTAQITAPEGFSDEPTTIQINRLVTPQTIIAPTNLTIPFQNIYELVAILGNGIRLPSFNTPVTFSITYSSEIETTYYEDTLQVYKYNEETEVWDLIECEIDMGNNTVTCALPSFSVYALYGQEIPPASPSDGDSSSKVCKEEEIKQPDLFQIDAKKNEVTLYISPLDNAKNYQVFYGLDENVEMHSAQFRTNYTDGVVAFSIKELHPNTSYSFKVRGGNSCVYGEWGNTMKISTTGGDTTIKFYKNFLTRVFSPSVQDAFFVGSKNTQSGTTDLAEVSTSDTSADPNMAVQNTTAEDTTTETHPTFWQKIVNSIRNFFAR